MKLLGLVVVLALLARLHVTIWLAGLPVTVPAIVFVAVAELLGLAGLVWLTARHLWPRPRLAAAWRRL